jgi:hypothetical protein
MHRWASNDENERQAAVRHPTLAIEIAVEMEVDTLNSEFGRGPRPDKGSCCCCQTGSMDEACEDAWWGSMEELVPILERDDVGQHLPRSDGGQLVDVADNQQRRIIWRRLPRCPDQHDVDHRRLVDDEQIAIERIVGIAFEPTTSRIDLREPVDRLALTIPSRPFWLWRAADGDGEVLDLCSNDAGKRIGLRPHELSAQESAPV